MGGEPFPVAWLFTMVHETKGAKERSLSVTTLYISVTMVLNGLHHPLLHPLVHTTSTAIA